MSQQEYPDLNADSSQAEPFDEQFLEVVSDDVINKILDYGQKLRNIRNQELYQEIRYDDVGQIDSMTEYYRGEKFRSVCYSHVNGLAIPISEYIYQDDRVVISYDYSSKNGRLSQSRYFFHDQQICFYQHFDLWGKLIKAGYYSKENLEIIGELELDNVFPEEESTDLDKAVQRERDAQYTYWISGEKRILFVSEVPQPNRKSFKLSMGSILRQIINQANLDLKEYKVIAAQKKEVHYDILTVDSRFHCRWHPIMLTGKVYPLSDEVVIDVVMNQSVSTT